MIRTFPHRYQDNAKNVSHSYKYRPKQALETAVWWTEYIAKTEGGHLLRSRATYMSAFEFYCLDIYLFWVLLGLGFILLGKILLKKMFTRPPPVKKVKGH